MEADPSRGGQALPASEGDTNCFSIMSSWHCLPPTPALSTFFAPSVLHDPPLQTCSLEGHSSAIRATGSSQEQAIPPQQLVFPSRRAWGLQPWVARGGWEGKE